MPRDDLTVADVLAMHTALIQRYRRAPGVRDPGALEAALFRPQTGYYEEMMQMFDAGTLDIAHLDPWLRGFARSEE